MGNEDAVVGASVDGEIDRSTGAPTVKKKLTVRIDIPSDAAAELFNQGGILRLDCTIRVV